MFVTKKRLYTELVKVMDIVNGIGDIQEGFVHRHNREIEDIKERINYTLNQVIKLSERIGALEAKKTVKKTTTKKTKGK